MQWCRYNESKVQKLLLLNKILISRYYGILRNLHNVCHQLVYFYYDIECKTFCLRTFFQFLEKVFGYIILPTQNTSYSKRRHDQKYVVLINKTSLIAWYSFELIYIFTESFSDIVWDCYLCAFLGIPYTYFPTCL